MSEVLLKKVLEERANVWEQAKAHLDTVEKEGREFSGEADETWGKLNGRLTELDARARELTAVIKANKDAEEARAFFDSLGGGKAKEEAAAPSDADTLRAMARGEQRSAEFRDLTVGTASAGGNTVSTGFVNQLSVFLTQNSAIRQSRVNILTTGSGNSLQVPKLTGRPTAAIIGEGSTVTESDPTFGQVTLGAYKYGFSLQISSELEQDTDVDLTGVLAQQFAIALANATGNHYVNGTGSSQPQGILTAASTGVTGGTGVTGAFTTDNLIDLYYSVAAPYRTNGEWLMSDSAVKTARKLKDTTNQYLWQPGLALGEPDMLLGRPVRNDAYVPAVAVSAASVAFGDMSTYTIRDVASVRVERSVDFAFQNDLITWRVLFRTDGKQIDTTGSIKKFVGGAS